MNKPQTFRGSVTDLSTISSENNVSEIEIMRVGKWNHPFYGEFEITPERLERFKRNFDEGVRKAVAIDIEHKSDEGAVGWVSELIFKGDILTAKVEWTDEGAELIKKKKYRFFSPEFADDYTDAATDASFKDVLIGGAITNRPFFQELEEIVLSDKTMQSYKMGGYECPECKMKMDKSKIVSHKKDKHKKGGETKMNREELKKKLLENPDFTLAEAGVDSKLFDEVKTEIDTEAEEAKKKEEAEAEAKKTADEEAAKKKKEEEEEAAKKGSVTISAKKLSELEAQARLGVSAHKEIEALKMSEQLKQYTMSEGNKDGIILPKDVDAVKAFALTLGENQRKMFFDIISKLPKSVKMFAELGNGANADEPIEGDYNAELDRRANKLMSESPDKFKTYRDAAYAAEKQMKEEGYGK